MKLERLAIFFLLFASSIDVFAGVSINASEPPYNQLPLLQGTSVRDGFETRLAIGFAVAGAYRAANGFSTLANGSTFTLTYQDGSKEEFLVANRTSNVGTPPIPGTQKDANGNTIPNGVGGSTLYQWLFSSGIWSFFGPSGCIGNCSGTVIVHPVIPQ